MLKLYKYTYVYLLTVVYQTLNVYCTWQRTWKKSFHQLHKYLWHHYNTSIALWETVEGHFPLSYFDVTYTSIKYWGTAINKTWKNMMSGVGNSSRRLLKVAPYGLRNGASVLSSHYHAKVCCLHHKCCFSWGYFGTLRMRIFG